MPDEKKILLVDDDPEDREIIEDGFATIGATNAVHFEENGERAMQFLEQTVQRKASLPCLIVLDLNMPRMNGTQTLRAIKLDSRFCDIPVLIYSTSLNPIEKQECMLLGAQDYIIKPVSYNESLNTARYFANFCGVAGVIKEG